MSFQPTQLDSLIVKRGNLGNSIGVARGGGGRGMRTPPLLPPRGPFNFEDRLLLRTKDYSLT